MKVNTARLKGLIVEKNTSQESVAERIGMNRSTFYRKVKQNGKTFTISEIHQMVKVIPLTKEEAIEIFLNGLSQ